MSDRAKLWFETPAWACNRLPAAFDGCVLSLACVPGTAGTAAADLVVSVGMDTAVRVWDIGTGELVRTLSGHGDRVSAVVHLEGDTVATGSDDCR